MKTYHLFIDLFFLSANFGFSGCSSVTITPENPDKIVVLGHNSTNVEFRWGITLRSGEEIKDFLIKRNVKYKGATKETILVTFDVDRIYSNTNSSLYTFTYNYVQGSSSGFFSFTIKDITKQEGNADRSKFRYLSDELNYLLEITLLKDKNRRESKIQLLILSLPHIYYLTSHVNAKQGDSITLRCNASGHPAPRATWIHKDMNTVIAQSFVTSINITGRASEGMYCCHVTNGAGEATNCTSISVMEYQPINTILTSNVKFSTANATFTVFCEAEASPPATYFIQQGNKTLQKNASDGNITVVTPVYGSYINMNCIAKNKYGDGNPSFIRIPIYEPATIVTHWDHPVTTNRTNNTFQCKATGIPAPTITWYNTADDKVVSSENGTLEVKNEECRNMTLKYYCKAVNDAGKATRKLIVKGSGILPNNTQKIIIVVVVCVLLLLIIILILFLIFILIPRIRRSKRSSRDTHQPHSRQNQLVVESPYGEPIDAIPLRSGIIPSGSNVDYATVEETGYRRGKTSNQHFQEPHHDDEPRSHKTKPIVEPVYAKVKKKKKKDVTADIPLNPIYAEIPGITPQINEQNTITPQNKKSNEQEAEDGVDSGQESSFPCWVY